MIGKRFDDRLRRVEKNVEEFFLLINDEIRKYRGDEESLDLTYRMEPTSFSFVEELVREVSLRFNKERMSFHDTPGKGNQATAIKVNNENNKCEKTKPGSGAIVNESKFSLPSEINILKDSDINLKGS